MAGSFSLDRRLEEEQFSEQDIREFVESYANSVAMRNACTRGASLSLQVLGFYGIGTLRAGRSLHVNETSKKFELNQSGWGNTSGNSFPKDLIEILSHGIIGDDIERSEVDLDYKRVREGLSRSAFEKDRRGVCLTTGLTLAGMAGVFYLASIFGHFNSGATIPEGVDQFRNVCGIFGAVFLGATIPRVYEDYSVAAFRDLLGRAVEADLLIDQYNALPNTSKPLNLQIYELPRTI